MFEPANDANPALDISDADLRQYVQGGLGPERRRSVEGFLACNPDLAAKVMTHLHMSPKARPRVAGRIWASALAVVLALGLGSGVGWTAAEREDLDGWRELDGEVPPGYVEEAAESREAVRLRAGMSSQPESTNLDAGEILRTLRVPIPALPASWRVMDVQVFPADDGPAVTLVLERPGRERLELFAVRAQRSATSRPELARRGGDLVAFWQRDEAAYVLSGPRSQRELIVEAMALSEGTIL